LNDLRDHQDEPGQDMFDTQVNARLSAPMSETGFVSKLGQKSADRRPDNLALRL
jgi:hypothetical protein